MLNVAFYFHSTKDYALDGMLMSKACAAVRKHLPYAEIWHLRGPGVQKHTSADREIYLEEFDRALHHSLMPNSPTLFLDIDCWVQKDIYEVFADKRDAWVCVRQQYDMNEVPSWEKPNYNCGVIFSNSQKFWQEYARFYAEQGRPFHDRTFCQFVDMIQKTFSVKRIPGLDYNYTPRVHDEDVSDKYIVHYKGAQRKYWMRHRPYDA